MLGVDPEVHGQSILSLSLLQGTDLCPQSLGGDEQEVWVGMVAGG